MIPETGPGMQNPNTGGFRADELVHLIEVVTELNSPSQLDSVLQKAAAILCSYLEMEACAISRWDRARDQVALWVEHAPSDWLVPVDWYKPYALADYPVTKAVLVDKETRQFRLDDPDIDPAEKAFMQSSKVKSLLMIPLVMQDRVLGLVELMDSSALRTFGPDEIQMARLLARHTAVAIDRAELLRTVEERAGQLEAVYQASLGLTSSLELPDVFEAILDAVRRLIPNSEGAHIFLYEENKLRFGVAMWEGGRKRAPFSEPRPDGLTYTVAREGREIVVPDMRSHPLYANVPHHWTGSIIGLPLKIGERVVGVMNVHNRRTGAFKESSLRILRLLGDQAAIAIENARLHNLVIEQARTDVTTGLFNRRALNSRLAEEEHRAARFERAFTLIMMDLDNFKDVNDSYGHPEGDKVLRQVAVCLASVVRETDFLARFGGDEFALVLTETDHEAGEQLAERIRAAIRRCAIELPDGKKMKLQFSMGLATFPFHARTATALLVAADKALYRAKESSSGELVCAPIAM